MKLHSAFDPLWCYLCWSIWKSNCAQIRRYKRKRYFNNLSDDDGYSSLILHQNSTNRSSLKANCILKSETKQIKFLQSVNLKFIVLSCTWNKSILYSTLHFFNIMYWSSGNISTKCWYVPLCNFDTSCSLLSPSISPQKFWAPGKFSQSQWWLLIL